MRSLDDLGDLASDELIEILGEMAPDMEAANDIIMAARAHWFDGEEDGTTEEAAPGDETAQGEAAATGENETASVPAGEQTT